MSLKSRSFRSPNERSISPLKMKRMESIATKIRFKVKAKGSLHKNSFSGFKNFRRNLSG